MHLLAQRNVPGVRCGEREQRREAPAVVNPPVPINALFWLPSLRCPIPRWIWGQWATWDAEKVSFYSWAQVVSWERFNGAITESLVNSEQASDSDLGLNMCLNDLLWLPRQHVLLNHQKKGGKNSFKHNEPQKTILIIKCISKYLVSISFSYSTLQFPHHSYPSINLKTTFLSWI